MQDIHRKNAKKLTVNPPDMSNKSNLEDFQLILYEATNDKCNFFEINMPANDKRQITDQERGQIHHLPVHHEC